MRGNVVFYLGPRSCTAIKHTLHAILTQVTSKEMTVGYQERIKLAREERDKQLPKEYRIPKDLLPGDDVKDVTRYPYESGLFTAKELEITDSSAPVILENIGKRKWTAVQVTNAFSKRAAVAHQLTNCLSNMFFERGEHRAKELDEYLGRTGQLMGPLHGLPVSIKDNHHIEGTTSAIGFSSLTGEKSSTNSAMVQILLKLGAVVYCKTTVPLAMMSIETETRLFGKTLNPFNRDHKPGGSSGGESALIGLGGSPVGIGSDIGGSIRVPCSNVGLYGLKGTSCRFPTAGTRAGNPGQLYIKSIGGPMARDLETVELIAKLVFNSSPEDYDNSVVPNKWSEPELPSKLTFGVLRCDGVVKPVPPVERAIEKAVENVKRQGHEVVEFEPWDLFKQLNAANFIFYTGDGFSYGKKLLGDEPPLDGFKFKDMPDRHISELFASGRCRMEVENAVFNQWNEKGIDGLISPIAAIPTHPHHDYQYIGYTAHWNSLDYPAIAIPMLRADAKIDGKPNRDTFMDPQDEQQWSVYDPERYDGGHVGIQVITRRYHEEKAFRLAQVVSDSKS
jgi:amidase